MRSCRKRKAGIQVCLFLVTLLIQVTAIAQTPVNTVKGYVRDESGQPVAGATVTVKNNQTGFTGALKLIPQDYSSFILWQTEKTIHSLFHLLDMRLKYSPGIKFRREQIFHY